ncbi:unnamed protein product [Adineta steineri]|uniref:Uncharacterized protein n=1 Tax=Adineta steineri TaxID=433720 RepID=A0A816EWT4_9BILA|nr:unnamed protein product [Adineta steineri]CAF1655024.1 unnamed protein product [Adineta steineri]
MNKKEFNILNPQNYEHCMEELSKNEDLLQLMQKGFQLTYDKTCGLQLDELQELIQLEHKENAQFMFKEIQKLSEEQSTWLAATSGDTIERNTIVVFGKIVDGKYDILTVRATQIKTFDKQKLIACGIGAFSLGVCVGAIATPLFGMLAGGLILAASGVKTMYDYQKDLPNLIYGYIFQQLTDKNVITVENGCYKI